MVKCPYCGYEGQFKVHKKWRFRFYDVERLECPRCGGVFNHYYGVSPGGKKSEYTIRVKPRATSAGHK
jgi:transposase-like protein